jgi:hypothetical protein
MLVVKLSRLSLPVILGMMIFLLSGCTPGTSSPNQDIKLSASSDPIIILIPTNIQLTRQPTATSISTISATQPNAYPSSIMVSPVLSSTLTPILTPTPDVRLTAYYWRNWPVIPTLSARAKQVFQHGQEMGNDLHSFSRIGDCQSVPAIFLGIYDSDRYWLPTDHEYLQLTIDQFSGSFSRPNVTVKDGFGVSSVLSPLMADPKLCQTTETPLECEYRLQKPIIAFIAMGTNWKPNSSVTFERYLRQVVEFCIEHGIVPVLMTKADNIEQDYLLNVSIARVAYDYDMPLLNSWLAVQYLPNHGLEEDKIYLSPEAWDTRNYTALEALDAIWNSLKGSLP